jgi:hypothetical protein
MQEGYSIFGGIEKAQKDGSGMSGAMMLHSARSARR